MSQRDLQHLAKIVAGLVRRLVAGDRLVKLADEEHRQVAALPGGFGQCGQRVELCVDGGERVEVHTALALGDFEGQALGDERLGDAPGDIVEPLDDPCLNGMPAERATPGLGELLGRRAVDRPLPCDPEFVDGLEHGPQRAVHRLRRCDLLPRMDDSRHDSESNESVVPPCGSVRWRW